MWMSHFGDERGCSNVEEALSAATEETTAKEHSGIHSGSLNTGADDDEDAPNHDPPSTAIDVVERTGKGEGCETADVENGKHQSG